MADPGTDRTDLRPGMAVAGGLGVAGVAVTIEAVSIDCIDAHGCIASLGAVDGTNQGVSRARLPSQRRWHGC